MGKRAKSARETPIVVTDWRDFDFEGGLFSVRFLSGELEFHVVMSPAKAREAVERASRKLLADNVVMLDARH